MVDYSGWGAFHGMREAMGWQGEGRRFTRGTVGQGLALGVALVVLALVGCAESAAEASSSKTSSSKTSTSPAAPVNVAATAPSSTAHALGARPEALERVVQRLSPAAEAERSENASSVVTGASAANARGSEPGVSDTTITPRHLEAELNRLEAELAN